MARVSPLASLSPALLARKGAARPAMRPQPFAAAAGDDLGWNDMGAPPADPAATPPGPAATPEAPAIAVGERDGVPVVLVEREALAQRIEAPAAVRSPSPATAARLRRETSHAGKAALTVRLDAERHLRLRLAGAITNRSAQDLMVQALDALIAAVPPVEALVAALPPAPSRKRLSPSR